MKNNVNHKKNIMGFKKIISSHKRFSSESIELPELEIKKTNERKELRELTS